MHWKKLSYQTITQPVQYELPKVKWSRFIGHLFPVVTREETETRLAELQKKYYDATHNCYAYQTDGVRTQTDLFGTILYESIRVIENDDGEPRNTAWKPILSQIQWAALFDVLLVVTRYFGGTKLGIWWLIQAYGQCAKETIMRATIQEKELTTLMSCTCWYDQLSRVMHGIEKFWCTLVEQQSNEQLSIFFRCNLWVIDLFRAYGEQYSLEIQLW